jgi:hypothetical protein
MPHCELDLYERMWHANWAADALPRILLVGNDLREYAAKYDHMYCHSFRMLNVRLVDQHTSWRRNTRVCPR